MGMRITTSMMMNTYKFNLQGSTKNLSDARNKVLTHRKFDSYAEDPASATQAWRIRRAMSSNYDYQANNSDTYSRFSIAWTSMGMVNNKLVDATGIFSTIRGENGAIGAGRQPLGQVLSKTAETIIQTMNSAKYSDHYVFSGEDEMNPPFSWNEDMTVLYYRGVNVNAGSVPRPDMTPDWAKHPTKPEWANHPVKPAWADYAIDSYKNLPIGMPDESTATDPAERAWENEWIAYYKDQALDSPTGVPKPDEVPWGMPTTSAATDQTEKDWENEWIQYYNDVAAGNSATKPDEVPWGMPNASTATDPEAQAWENSWIQYYKGLAQDPPVEYEKPEQVPEWTKAGDPSKMPDPATEWDEKWKKYLEDKKANPTDKNLKAPTLDPSEKDTAKWGEKDEFGVPEKAREILNDDNSTDEEKAWAKYLLDQGDLAKLDMMAAETQNIDLGMGMREDASNTLVNGTAFNRALPGLNMLGGYGVDEDGDPNNVVLIMKRIGELFTNSDPDSGEWDPDPEKSKALEAEAMRLLDKIGFAHDRTTESYVEIETRSKFLQENQTRLETQGDYLQEERANLEQVDLADAITEFSWDYYCYSAALKVGTQLLSQSLLDYMS